MNALELFAGIGGLSLGLERAGFHVVGQVEINPFCRRVLARHWPEVPRHDDVRTAIQWWDSRPRPRVDAVVGGYPCQPESLAGLRRGTNDERWLWPEMAQVVAHLRPRPVIGENVLGHRTKGLRFVLRDLARLGYTATPGVIRACEVGAPHARPRLFVLAYADGGDGPSWLGPRNGWPVPGRPGATPTWGDPLAGFMEAAARGRRVADGLSRRMDPDRIRAPGNAVVPAVAERIGRLALAGLGA